MNYSGIKKLIAILFQKNKLLRSIFKSLSRILEHISNISAREPPCNIALLSRSPLNVLLAGFLKQFEDLQIIWPKNWQSKKNSLTSIKIHMRYMGPFKRFHASHELSLQIIWMKYIWRYLKILKNAHIFCVRPSRFLSDYTSLSFWDNARQTPMLMVLLETYLKGFNRQTSCGHKTITVKSKYMRRSYLLLERSSRASE